ncbi:MAG: ribonuclease III [Phycisphaerales bacterium JB043]
MSSEQILREIQDRIEYEFRDPGLLRTSLQHASGATSRIDSNERLEFLGDAILGMVVCEYLYDNFPNALEGQLTKIKSAVVSRQTCAEIANALDLGGFLEIGKGMQTHRELPLSLLAALVEAIIGAIFVDSGLESARVFIMEHFGPIADRAARSGHHENFKSVLQQYVQEFHQDTPVYVLLDEQGPDHAKCFEVCVQIGSTRHGSSWGASKKQAEQQAALNALRELGLAREDENGEVRISWERDIVP